MLIQKSSLMGTCMQRYDVITDNKQAVIKQTVPFKFVISGMTNDGWKSPSRVPAVQIVFTEGEEGTVSNQLLQVEEAFLFLCIPIAFCSMPRAHGCTGKRDCSISHQN